MRCTVKRTRNTSSPVKIDGLVSALEVVITIVPPFVLSFVRIDTLEAPCRRLCPRWTRTATANILATSFPFRVSLRHFQEY